MSLFPRLKICLVAISLGRGGAERSTALLSQMLVASGHEVQVVILTDLVQYPYAGVLVNLGKEKEKSNGIFDKLGRIRRLRNFFKEQRFDWIIDNRTRPSGFKELLYSYYIYGGQQTVYVVRSAFLPLYLPKNRIIAGLIVKRIKIIVGVSQAIATKINTQYQTQKAVAIYNPVESDKASAGEMAVDPYVLFVGRLDEEVKNLSLLFQAYQQSVLPGAGIPLKVVGSGPDAERMKREVERLGIADHVEFHSFVADTAIYYRNALFTVLTSRFEGFPRVLIESLAQGTPVVAVDCESGPAEIVIPDVNGLLVPNHDVGALAEAFHRMVSDEKWYKNLKFRAADSVSHLSFPEIAAQWNKILCDEGN